jgi:hypothetical protein
MSPTTKSSAGNKKINKSQKVAGYGPAQNSEQSCAFCIHRCNSNSLDKSWCSFHVNYCDFDSVCVKFQEQKATAEGMLYA